VRAYTRVADQPIENRNKVYRPDHLVVLDATLLSDDVLAGLAPGGALVLNTTESAEVLARRYPAFRVAAIDATSIARAHKIGSRSVVIVNTTIAGALARVFGLELATLEAWTAPVGPMIQLIWTRPSMLGFCCSPCS
jgi:2-oxoacid:acceptor oxidoreductase gamma subunit (pyruvate/2-ketoisovalerate family)